MTGWPPLFKSMGALKSIAKVSSFPKSQPCASKEAGLNICFIYKQDECSECLSESKVELLSELGGWLLG